MQKWDEEFFSIVQKLDAIDIQEARSSDDLSKDEITRAILGMNECATYLGRHLMQCMFDPDAKIPSGLNAFIRELTELTDEISNVLSECNCEECQMAVCDNCTDEYMCEECVRRLEEDL